MKLCPRSKICQCLLFILLSCNMFSILYRNPAGDPRLATLDRTSCSCLLANYSTGLDCTVCVCYLGAYRCLLLYCTYLRLYKDLDSIDATPLSSSGHGAFSSLYYPVQAHLHTCEDSKFSRYLSSFTQFTGQQGGGTF